MNHNFDEPYFHYPIFYSFSYLSISNYFDFEASNAHEGDNQPR